MKVVVDNRVGGPLTRSQWKEARRLLPDQPASGRVMNIDAACRAQLRRGMMIGLGFLVACWITASFFAIVGKSDGAAGMLAGGVIVWLGTYLGFWVSVCIGEQASPHATAAFPNPVSS